MGNLVFPAAVVVGGLALALFLALYLFCTLKAEMRTAQRDVTHSGPSELGEWARRLEAVEARTREAAVGVLEHSEPLAVPISPAMNLSRRSQILRLSRRGENPEQIASRLGLGTGEVRLLLKIHRMLVDQALRGPGRREPLKSEDAAADKGNSADHSSVHVGEPI